MKKSMLQTRLASLISLAEAYAQAGREFMLPLSHWSYVGNLPSWQKAPDDYPFRTEGRDIQIYFGDKYETWEVRFGKYAVTGYVKSITIPWDLDPQDLDPIIADASDYLASLTPQKGKALALAARQKEEKIGKLQEELLALQDQLSDIYGTMAGDGPGPHDRGVHAENK